MTGRPGALDPLQREQVIAQLRDPSDPEALDLLDERWIEIWHLLPPSSLAPLLMRFPERALRTRPGAHYLKSMVMGDVSAVEFGDLLGPGAGRTPVDLMHVGAAIARTRISGRPVAAMKLADDYADVVEARATSIIEVSNGLAPYSSLQLGITALLAGDPLRALGFLERARAVDGDSRFGFIARDAHAKLALLHELYGEPSTAKTHLDRFRSLPPSTSWTEEWITQTAELAEALYELDQGRPIALPDRPLAEYGEMWPYALLVHVRDSLLRRDTERVERVLAIAEHAGLIGTDGDGAAASAIPLCRAQLFLARGHAGEARRAVLRAPQDLLSTQLLRARVAFISGEHEQAAVEATQGMTRAPGFFRHRVEFAGLLAAIHLQRGDDAVARSLMLTGLQARTALPRTLYRILPHELTSHARLAWRDEPRLASLVPADYRSSEYRPLTAPMGRAIDLSERERETLAHLVAGHSRAQIAERLFVSENTVKSHLRNLYRKIGVSGRESAILWAVTNAPAEAREQNPAP